MNFDSDLDTATVVLIDDHETVSDALGDRIKAKSSGLELVGSATTGEDGIKLVAELLPNVVLVDLGLPGIDGWEVCARIREQHPDMGIVIFTAYDSDENVLRAEAVGVSAYITKREKGRRVIQMLRMAAEEPHSFWSANLGDVHRRAQEKSDGDVTPTEVQMLELLRQGKTMREIGAELGLAESTTRIYLHRAYEKLGAKNGVQAVANAMSRGLLT